jgi:hypothetical protein
MATNRQLNIFHIDMNYVCLRTDFLKHWLKRIADMGFNAILWELEDKVQWTTCPECVWPEAMSKTEFSELLDYSRTLGLEAIPLLQTIGHAEYVLLHDKYKNFREQSDRYDCYCTSNSEVRDFLTAWIEEYLELFGDIRFFHLGGDEAYVFATCKKCTDLVKRKSKNQLYSEHINALAKPLLARNIRPSIWNDMIMHYPDSVELISKDFVIWDWNYWDTDTTPEEVVVRGHGWLKRADIDDELMELLPELLDENGKLQNFYSVRTLKKLGFDIILCSSASSAGDNFYCPAPGHAGNITGVAATVKHENLMGNCVTSWALRLNDFITQIPYIGLAHEVLAKPEQTSEAAFYCHCKNLFGIKPDKFIAATKIAGQTIPFASADSTSVQWDGMKGSVPAPKNYLHNYLENFRQNEPAVIENFTRQLNDAVQKLPDALKLFAEFFCEAEQGFDIIEYWLTATKFLLDRALVGQQILYGNKSLEIVKLLQVGKKEYSSFLARRETPGSAEKNAGLVYDALIDLLIYESENIF